MYKIAVIAGHHGALTGARGYFDEGRANIELRNMVATELRLRGVVPIEENSDRDTLTAVVSALRGVMTQYDICVDLHFNAVSNPQACGTEVIVPNDYSADEWQVGEKILTGLCSLMGTRNRGVKREIIAGREGLRMLTLPCRTMIVEVCFCTNQRDAEAYQRTKLDVARHIADVLIHYARSDKY